MSLTIYYTTIVRSWKIIMWEASSSSASLLTLKRTHAMPDKGNKVETSTLTAIPFDDIETTRETHLFDRERKREKWLFILLRLRLQLHLWITMDHHHQQLTHQWITQTATTLPPTVAQQLSNVNWKRRKKIGHDDEDEFYGNDLVFTAKMMTYMEGMPTTQPHQKWYNENRIRTDMRPISPFRLYFRPVKWQSLSKGLHCPQFLLKVCSLIQYFSVSRLSNTFRNQYQFQVCNN